MKSRYVLKNMRTSIRKFFFIRNFRKLRRLRNVSIQFVDDVNTQEFINKIEDNSLAICTGFSQILNKTLLSKFTDAYNFHQSLLPFYKGPVPNYWVIKNKEKWTGYSIHRMSSSVDDGEIVYQQKIEVKTNKDKVLPVSYTHLTLPTSDLV